MHVADWNSGEGITVLGIPVDRPGSSSTTSAAWRRAASCLEATLDQISQLPDAQLGHHLLRACADGCKVNHLLRATDSYSVPALIQQAHNAILSSFEDMTGISLLPHQRLQACLPLHNGGCGIKGLHLLQPTARISALAAFYSRGAVTVGLPNYARKIVPSLIQPVLSDLTSRLGINCDPLTAWDACPDRLSTASNDHCSQHWWSTTLGARVMLDLLDQLGPRDQARLLEQRTGLGSTWM